MGNNTKPFKRGIHNKEFIKTLNTLYTNQESFWFKMVRDKELFIAIRDECLNVYYYGQSLCKLSFDNGQIIGLTNKKYLGNNNGGYLKSINGIVANNDDGINNLSDITEIKKRMDSHIGQEKRESYKVILSHDVIVVDTEITFVKLLVENPKKQGDYEQSSIDYLVLDGNKLVFYEAKHYNNSEIRSRTVPKVFRQISRYKEALIDHENEIATTYKTVIQNLNDLKITDIKTRNFVIDKTPRLIVFGVDDDESMNKHLLILREKYGDRLVLK